MRNNLCIAAALAILALGTNATAGPSWTVTDLGTLGGNLSFATSINNSGQIVGDSVTADFPPAPLHAFLYSNGSMTDLGTPGVYTDAVAINNIGQIAVYSIIADQTAHAFLYSNGTKTDLGTLGGNVSFPYSINNSGDIVGYSRTAADTNNRMHAFVYTNGTMTDLGTLGGTESVANGINDKGQIAGSSYLSGDVAYHSFLYSNGAMTDLGTLGGTVGFAAGINNAGQIVGSSYISGNVAVHAYLYADGAMIDLGTLGGASFGSAINNSGQVVGYSYTPAGRPHGFLYENGSMLDLSTLPDVQNAGWSDLIAGDINDSGQIVGQGTIGNQTHAFLLSRIPEPSAVPEPSTLAILLAGLYSIRAARVLRIAKS